MTPTDATRPADGPGPAAGHTDTPDAREGLRGLLGDRYEAVIEKAMSAPKFYATRTYTIRERVADTLAAVLPNLLAEAWDEGYSEGFHDGHCGCSDADYTTPNPYRTEGNAR